MVLFDNRSSVSSSSNRYRRSPAHRSAYSTNHPRHSAPSLISMGSSTGSGAGRKSPSAFSSFSASSSSRRARPRAGFVKRVVRYIKRTLRDIYHWARRHPIKFFFMVIVPLIVSGVLQKLLAMIGVHLPRRVFGKLAGPAPGEGLRDHIWGLMRVAKMVS